jgi:uncharacterized membrane protein YbhN (UPF0104 family)
LGARLPIIFRCETSRDETDRHHVTSVARHCGWTLVCLSLSAKTSANRDALRHASLSWVLLGWICYSVVEVLATVHWQILLRIQGIRIGWLQAGAIVIIGLFFNQFLPGGIGGDA